MIRINLLPVKAAQRRASGVRQLLIAALALLISLTGVVAFHIMEESDLAAKKAEVKRLSDAIAKLKSEIGDYEETKRQREDLIRQKKAIEQLQAQRGGPTFVMRELSDMLTKGKGPTVDKESYEELLRKDPSGGFNPNWEPKRAWLITFQEKSHAVTIKGGAKSDEDVAEFLKRMKLSAFFDKVYWQQTQPQTDSKLNNVSYVVFDVQAVVNY